MAKEKIIVDKKQFSSRKKAIKFFLEAMIACEGSEGERMTFAYTSLLEGASVINTYKGTAV